MKNILYWTWWYLKPVLLTLLICYILILLMEHYSIPVALGLISLAMTVLPGTDIIKKYVQINKAPNGKTTDIWGLISISVGIVGTIIGILEGQIIGKDANAYVFLLITLGIIMLVSAILKKTNRK